VSFYTTEETVNDWGEVGVTVASLTADGDVSDSNTVSLQVRNPTVAVDNPWYPDAYPEPVGSVGVPGQFGFSVWDLSEVTTKFLWHVNDGPVRETTYDPWAWETKVSYTPDRAGDNTLYVQREFTDGSKSPMVSVPFEVGTRPLITSDVYQVETPSGGADVTGVFRFSGGMPGVIRYDYRFVAERDGAEAAAGEIDAAADGSAQVTFTPAAAGYYTVQVTGHTADGTATTEAVYRFEVAGS
jgi:hypothetical protein